MTPSKKNKPASFRKVLFPQTGSSFVQSKEKETITRKNAALRKEADGWDALVRESMGEIKTSKEVIGKSKEEIETTKQAKILALKRELDSSVGNPEIGHIATFSISVCIYSTNILKVNFISLCTVLRGNSLDPNS